MLELQQILSVSECPPGSGQQYMPLGELTPDLFARNLISPSFLFSPKLQAMSHLSIGTGTPGHVAAQLCTVSFRLAKQ